MHTVKGWRAVLEALRANVPISRIIVSEAATHRSEFKDILKQAKFSKLNVQTSHQKRFQKEYPDKQNQGIVAYVSPKTFTPLDHLCAHPDHYPIVLALDHIEDPYNFGAILRTAEQMGVRAVIFPKDRSCQITPGVIKASSGAIHYLEMVRVVNVAQSLDALRNAGYWLIGTQIEEGTPLPDFTPVFPMVLVLGNEAKGQSRRISKMVDSHIYIPTNGRVSSLNVSVAAGILAYTIHQHYDSEKHRET